MHLIIFHTYSLQLIIPSFNIGFTAVTINSEIPINSATYRCKGRNLWHATAPLACRVRGRSPTADVNKIHNEFTRAVWRGAASITKHLDCALCGKHFCSLSFLSAPLLHSTGATLRRSFNMSEKNE